MDEATLRRIVREESAAGVLDAVDPGLGKGKDPDNRIGFMLADTHKTARRLHDAVFGLPSGEVSRDATKSPSLLKRIAAKLGA